MKRILIVCMMVGTFSCHSQQTKLVGGPCEGCEALLEYPDEKLNSVDTLPGFQSNHPKLRISGTVYQKDGKTPASDIILYIYHTNNQGIYPSPSKAKGWVRRHGIHRGWIKTNRQGQYMFYTFKPGSYPNRNEPVHIHLVVKESGLSAYYLDDFLFADDPLLTHEKKKKLTKRGGSGIVSPVESDNEILTIERDIILGLNIPDYEN